jgi:hypothetical protein
LTVVNTVMNLPIPLKMVNFFTSWETVICSSRALLLGVSEVVN